MVTRLDSKTRLRVDIRKVSTPELVAEFEQTMDEIADHVLYIRRDRAQAHRCLQAIRQQSRGLGFCPTCYGTGNPIIIERHLGRHWSQASPGKLTRSYERVDPGMLSTPSTNVFLKPVAHPKPGDLIVRVEWNKVTMVPVSIIEILSIEAVTDEREEQGILVFYQCFCQVESINVAAFESLLRKERRIRVID